MKHFIAFTIRLILSLPLLLPALSHANALDDELQATIAAYKQAGADPRDVLRPLKWSGVTAPALFDLVEKDLLENLQQKGREWTEGNSWRVQSLAFSGNTKYRKTIETTIAQAKSSKLRRHAKSSLEVIDDFAIYNPIIAAELEKQPAERLEKQRIINMITSDNYELVRAGASRIYHHHPNDPEFLELTEKRIEELYSVVQVLFPDADAVGWLCKVLGKTEDEKYEALLKKVAKESPAKALRRHANKALETLRDDHQYGPDRLM